MRFYKNWIAAVLLLLAACGPSYEYKPHSTGEIPATINAQTQLMSSGLLNVVMATAGVQSINGHKIGMTLVEEVKTIQLPPGQNSLKMIVDAAHYGVDPTTIDVAFNALPGMKYTFSLEGDELEFSLLVKDGNGQRVFGQHFIVREKRWNLL